LHFSTSEVEVAPGRRTAATVFGQLMARGFSSRVAIVNALNEFAQIE